jgi:hypothetical protein
MGQMFGGECPGTSHVTEIRHIPSLSKFAYIFGIKHIKLYIGLHRYESEALQWRTPIG